MTSVDNIAGKVAQDLAYSRSADAPNSSASRLTAVQKVQSSEGAADSASGNNNVAGALVKNADTSKTVALKSEALNQAASEIEKYVDLASDKVKLSINRDEETGRFVYRSIDKESGEVVKQFPSEEILALIQRVRVASGLVLDSKV